MRRRHYVSQAGIKREPISIVINGHTITLDSYTYTVQRGGPHKGKTLIRCKSLRIDGQLIEYVCLDNRPELRQQIDEANATYQAQFEQRYPGIYALAEAIDNDRHYHTSIGVSCGRRICRLCQRQFDRMMEDEDNDGVRPPAHPKMSVNDARKLYPVAAAYLTILHYSESDPSCETGYNKRHAGEQALKELESGADVIATRDKMVAEYKAITVIDRS